MPRLFVYGTLKRGDVRAGALAGQNFLGEAWTEPQYRLFDCGEYPALVEVAIDGIRVQGELYDVSPDRLAMLDEVEGVAEGLYARQPIALAPPFEASPVEAYFYRQSVHGLPDCGERWTPRGGQRA